MSDSHLSLHDEGETNTLVSPSLLLGPTGKTFSIEGLLGAWLHEIKGVLQPKSVEKYALHLSLFRSFLQAQHQRDLVTSSCGYQHDQEERQNLAQLCRFYGSMRMPESHTPDKKVSASTQQTRLAALKSFYLFAMRYGYISYDDPTSLIPRPSITAYQHAQPLSLESVMVALQSIDRTTLIGKRDYALLFLFLLTASRSDAMSKLQWGDIEWKKGGSALLTFRHLKGGKKTIHVEIPVAITSILLEWLIAFYGEQYGAHLERLPKDASLWVSLSPKQSEYGQQMGYKAIAYTCERHIGTSKVHALRHTAASLFHQELKKGTDDLRTILGHQKYETTDHYIHEALTRQLDSFVAEMADLLTSHMEADPL